MTIALRFLLLTLVLTLTVASVGAQGPSGDPDPTDATPSVAATASAIPPTATPGPVDGYEPDNDEPQASWLTQGELQERTFYSPHGRDRDYVLVNLKVGRWRIAARTTTGHYDPRMRMGALFADDEEGKNAILEVTVTNDGKHLLMVDNAGVDGVGRYTLSLERIALPTATVPPTIAATYTPYPTYTPQPTLTSPPTVAATYTPYPTYTPQPTQSAVAAPTQLPYPTQRPYPTAVNVAQPPPSTPYLPGQQGAADKPTSSAPLATNLTGLDRLDIEIFLDVNRDGVMNWGEASEGILVVATVASGQWQQEAYVVEGTVFLDLADAPVGEELLILVPYLHRSARLPLEGGLIRSQITLQMPIYPSYLP